MGRAIGNGVKVGLGAKIFLTTAMVVVVVLGGALLVTAQRAGRAADQSIDRALTATQAAIDEALERRTHVLAQVAGAQVQVPQYLAQIEQALRPPGNRADLLDRAGEFRDALGATWAAITNNSGILKAWTGRPDSFDIDMSEGSLVGQPLSGAGIAEGIYIEGTADSGFTLFQAVGVPIRAPGTAAQRALYGVLLAAVPVDSVFLAELKRNTSSEIVIVALDDVGQPHLAVSTLPRASIASALASAPGMDTSLAGLQPGGHVRWDVGDETLIGIVGPLVTGSGIPVGAYVGFRSRNQELAVFTQLQQTILLAFVVGLVLAIVSSVVLARQITRPVTQLVSVTRQIGDGQYSGTIEVTSRDEIGVLAGAFQKMLQDLREKQALIEYMSTAAAATLQVTQGQMADAVTQKIQAGTTTRAMQVSGGQMLESGSVLDGRYEIKKVLGVGGMGVVYRAQDRELDETVAIKTLKPDAIQSDGSSLERFKQEIRLARRITHRNVVRTHDLGEVQGMYYITMEFVEGTSLKDLIKKRGHLPAAVALTVGKQMLRALEVAHEEGVVHRDIKPQNMVVDAAGFLKVMDFGIARLAEKHQENKGLTAAGVAIGTPEYMAPEQLMGEEIDARADLYAAGAVLFECCTGRPVFVAPTVTALMVKHLEEKPMDPREVQPDVPAALASIILKALSKKREDRWQSATAFHSALEGVRVEAPVGPRVSGGVTQPV